MSGKGDCWDNAITESFFARFKTELGDMFENQREANKDIFDYWLFYNKQRLHSTLGFVPPERYEKHMCETQQLAA